MNSLLTKRPDQARSMHSDNTSLRLRGDTNYNSTLAYSVSAPIRQSIPTGIYRKAPLMLLVSHLKSHRMCQESLHGYATPCPNNERQMLILRPGMLAKHDPRKFSTSSRCELSLQHGKRLTAVHTRGGLFRLSDTVDSCAQHQTTPSMEISHDSSNHR